MLHGSLPTELLQFKKNKKYLFRALFFLNRCRSGRQQIFAWKLCPHLQVNFSGIQIGRVLKQLQDSDFTTEEIADQVLPRLGLKPSARLARQLLDLHNVLKTMNLPESLLRLGSEDLLPLLKFSQSALPDLAALSERMEVRGKKWRNLLHVLDEVSRLREMSADEVLKLPEILEIIGRSSLQAPVRYRLLKQQLDTWRYPELSDLRQRFEQGRQRLNLSPRITLEIDPYFENDDLTLSLKNPFSPGTPETFKRFSKCSAGYSGGKFGRCMEGVVCFAAGRMKK